MSIDKETFPNERNTKTAPMRALIGHVRRQAVSYLALFVALGGTGYAAANLPRASVGARQIKNHAITPSKFDPKLINGSVRAWAVVRPDGKIVQGAGKPEGAATVTPGDYQITWGVRLKRACATIATLDSDFLPGAPGHLTVGPISAVSSSGGAKRVNNVTHVDTFNQFGQITAIGFDLAVVC